MNTLQNNIETQDILEVMSKRNVTISSIGTKITNGIDTQELCLVVGVDKKITEEQLDPNDIVPKTLKNGVKTDVVIHPRIFAMTGCNEDPTQRVRPIRGGVSAIREGQTACTLGCIVKDSLDKKLVGLTNNHCAGIVYNPLYATPSNGVLNSTGDNNFQPSVYDGGTSGDIYGSVKRVHPIAFGSATGNYVDASISSINEINPVHDILNISEEPLAFELNKNAYSQSIPVFKNGRTTCYTSGMKANYNINVNVRYANPATNNETALFLDQIYISGSNQFSNGGDSGSVIVSNISGEDKIIGLLFAGGEDGNGGYITIANHISDVAQTLNIESWNGDIVVSYNESPTITLNGKTYQRLEDTYEEITHIV